MPAVGLGGRDAPARPGESRWRLGPGFFWESNSTVEHTTRGKATGSDLRCLDLWCSFLSRTGCPPTWDLAGKLEGLGTGRCRVSQQAGMPAVGLGGRRPLRARAKVGGGWGRVLTGNQTQRSSTQRGVRRLGRTCGVWICGVASCRARGALLRGTLLVNLKG